MKNIITEQNRETANQRVRITELEQKAFQNKEAYQPQPKGEDVVQKQETPSYTLVVTSGNLGKKEMANTIKKVEPSKLDIHDATMREGRGVVITTLPQGAVGK